MTPRQKIATLRRYQVRSNRLRKQLPRYQRCDRRYQHPDLVIDENALGSPSCILVDQCNDVAEDTQNDASTKIALCLDEFTVRFNAPPAVYWTMTTGEDD